MLAASRSASASTPGQLMQQHNTRPVSQSLRLAHRSTSFTHTVINQIALEATVARSVALGSRRSHPSRLGLTQRRSASGSTAASQHEQPVEQQKIVPNGDSPQGLHAVVACVASAVAHVLRQLQRFRVYMRVEQAALCMSAAAAVPLSSRGLLEQLTGNYVFVVGFWAWFAAQSAKIFTKRVREGVWDVTAIVDSGGMPSSHSSLCMAVTTAVGHKLGAGSPIFAVALAFSLIVMYDAANVRWHAGKQAEVLNIVMADLLEGHPISEKKMKEVLGHTPLQVAVGAILGVLVGLFYPTPLSAFPS